LVLSLLAGPIAGLPPYSAFRTPPRYPHVWAAGVGHRATLVGPRARLWKNLPADPGGLPALAAASAPQIPAIL